MPLPAWSTTSANVKAAFTLEELGTVICDCEEQVNSRPLTHVSETNSDPVPLTPAMYLRELQTIEVPDYNQFEEDHLVRRLRYRRKICEQLRRRFRLEYLGQLSWTKRKNTREPSLVTGNGGLVKIFIGVDLFFSSLGQTTRYSSAPFHLSLHIHPLNTQAHLKLHSHLS